MVAVWALRNTVKFRDGPAAVTGDAFRMDGAILFSCPFQSLPVAWGEDAESAVDPGVRRPVQAAVDVEPHGKGFQVGARALPSGILFFCATVHLTFRRRLTNEHESNPTFPQSPQTNGASA